MADYYKVRHYYIMGSYKVLCVIGTQRNRKVLQVKGQVMCHMWRQEKNEAPQLVISSVIPRAVKRKPDNENCAATNRQDKGCRAHEQEDGPLLARWRQPGETFTLHIFGSSALTTVKRSLVKLSLENVWDKWQSNEIEAVVTPKVCTALMKVPG